MSAKPHALAVKVKGIPDALKADRRWVLWRYVLKGERWSKLPFQILDSPAKSNDPSTWTTFDHALNAYLCPGRFDGLGFVLGDGWAGIDLDHVAHAPAAFLDRLTCYRETSPSGAGLKAIGRATRVGGELKFVSDGLPVVTPWSGARYFAITGHGSGDPTLDITTLLDELFPRTTAPTSLIDRPAFLRDGDVRGTELIERLTDDQVVLRILGSPQAEKFLRLVRGDTSDYGHDHSRADQALVSILGYWCVGDLDQVDRLFRQTALMRPKWDSESYRRATLRKAVRL